VDAHLVQGGLGGLVEHRPGVRIPGVLDGFEAVLRTVLSESPAGGRAAAGLVATLGEPVATDVPELTHLMPTAASVAEAGVTGLAALGVPPHHAAMLAAVAGAMASGVIPLEPGGNVAAARRALLAIEGVDGRLATMIVMRALYWPDAFPASDPSLQRAASRSAPVTLDALSERWRPWRAYAAHHLWLDDNSGHPEQVLDRTRTKPARQRRARLVSSA
jgi:AraC family transcriptional regulator of adaptative response / DNA-3-methyladenine glycosylase II